MYCELSVKHGKTIDAASLEHAIRAPFDNDLPLAAAYGRSAIYGRVPPAHSLFAFETVQNCFVIVRKVNVRFSTYHLEGNSPAISVETMLTAAQEFATQLISVLDTSACKAKTLTVQLFEDNGRETGMEGKMITWSSVFLDKFSWKELKSSVISFVTSALLIWRGLKQEPLRASIYSLLIVIVFTLGDAIFSGSAVRGKINWKLRQI
jgi:hypothetical protein